MRDQKKYSSTVEDYLKKIVKHLIEKKNKKLSTGDLSKLLGVTPGSATSMMKKLADDGFVNYHSHQGCTLTSKGKRFGISMLRRHRLLEMFLLKILGYELSEVHNEAEVMEHSVSEKFIDKVDEILAFPGTDPHGDIIPSKNQYSIVYNESSLIVSELKTQYTVKRIGGDEELIKYFEENNITPGSRIKIEELDKKTETAKIVVNGSKFIVGLKVLEEVFITP
jgi:DtxR family Mn-dependent transcriptional regulator